MAIVDAQMATSPLRIDELSEYPADQLERIARFQRSLFETPMDIDEDVFRPENGFWHLPSEGAVLGAEPEPPTGFPCDPWSQQEQQQQEQQQEQQQQWLEEPGPEAKLPTPRPPKLAIEEPAWAAAEPPAWAATDSAWAAERAAADTRWLAMQDLLEELGLPQLLGHAALRACTAQGLVEIFTEDGRLCLLSELKAVGVERLQDRQAFANALGKALRNGTLPVEEAQEAADELEAPSPPRPHTHLPQPFCSVLPSAPPTPLPTLCPRALPSSFLRTGARSSTSEARRPQCGLGKRARTGVLTSRLPLYKRRRAARGGSRRREREGHASCASHGLMERGRGGVHGDIRERTRYRSGRSVETVCSRGSGHAPSFVIVHLSEPQPL